MSDQHTVLRSMHDTGLAAWFGGSLMGVVGLNGAVAEADQPTEPLHISAVGWKRWAPVPGSSRSRVRSRAASPPGSADWYLPQHVVDGDGDVDVLQANGVAEFADDPSLHLVRDRVDGLSVLDGQRQLDEGGLAEDTDGGVRVPVAAGRGISAPRHRPVATAAKGDTYTRNPECGTAGQG